MPLAAGNLREQPFEEIWKSSTLLRDLRSGQLGQAATGTRGMRASLPHTENSARHALAVLSERIDQHVCQRGKKHSEGDNPKK
jgi:MoaA/NifB/PqqE/SkfB family radical SAM enzyme